MHFIRAYGFTTFHFNLNINSIWHQWLQVNNIWKLELLTAVWTHSHATGILLGIYSCSSRWPLVNLEHRKLKKETRNERKSTELCLLLQTPPAEAHWLVALAPPSLIGSGLALPSAVQPDRRGGRHQDRKFHRQSRMPCVAYLNTSHSGIIHGSYLLHQQDHHVL